MFADDQRQIFRYFNGLKAVCADPVRIHRKLFLLLEGRLNYWLEQCHADDPDRTDGRDPIGADQAKDRVLAAVRESFPMAPFSPEDGMGALEDDCWAALEQFLDFLDQKKTSTESSPTSPVATGLPVSSAVPQPTTNTSASGKTPCGCG